MTSITQTEFDKQFAEYVKGKEVNIDNLLEHILDYEKKLKEKGITVRAGFSVDHLGKVTHEERN
jgi:hypothetical protein